MPQGYEDFLKEGAGQLKGKTGLLFGAVAIKDIVDSDNKLKAILKTLKEFIFWKQLLAVGMVNAFGALGKSIRSIVKDTGSLEAALNKLKSIQGFERVFAPLVGGAEAAKRKVAELVNFASKSPFQFKDIGEGARSLQVFTRGAYSSAQALKVVGDAAAASGNGFSQTADVVSEFYDELRNGQPVSSTAEKMREMGLISSEAADKLIRMQEGGSGLNETFSQLTGYLAGAVGGMDSLLGSVDGVNAAYEKAQATLQEKFASPFIAEDVERTKKLTTAIQNMTPAIARVAQAWASWTATTAGIKASLLAWATSFPAVQSAVETLGKAIPILTMAISLGSAVVIGQFIPALIGMISKAGMVVAGNGAFLGAMQAIGVSSGAAATGVTIASRALATFAAVGGAAMIVAALAPVIAVLSEKAGELYATMFDGYDKSMDASTKMAQAHDMETAALQRQINAIDTVNQKREAMAKVLQKLIDLEAAARTAPLSERQEIARQTRKATIQKMAIENNTNASDPEQVAENARRHEAELKLHTATVSASLENATPEQRAQILQAHSEEMDRRSKEAKAGLDAQSKYSPGKLIEAQNAAHAAGLEYNNMPQDASQSDFLAATMKKYQTTNAAENFGMDAPETSSVYADAMMRKAEKDKDFKKRDEWKYQGEIRRKEEDRAGALGEEAPAAKKQAEQAKVESDLAEARLDAETRISKIKSIGSQRAIEEYLITLSKLKAEKQALANRPDLQQAKQAEIDTLQESHRQELRANKVDRFGSMAELTKTRALAGLGPSVNLAHLGHEQATGEIYEAQKGKMGDKNAQDYAVSMVEAQTRVSDMATMAGQGSVVDSLQSVGGGGNVANQGVSMADILKDSKDVQESMRDYLKAIAKQETTLK